MLTKKPDAPIYTLAEYRDGTLPRGPRTRSLSYASAELARREGRREPSWRQCALVRITWHGGRMIETVLEILD